VPSSPHARPLRIVCIGAHPDDVEAGCGGTIARYADLGHRVTIVYLTRGERGIPGTHAQATAEIRTAEAEEACRILGAVPRFAGHVDGETGCTPGHVAEFQALLAAEHPDIVFAHWPVDTHADHQTTGILTLRAVLAPPEPVALYFFEVNRGVQTMDFHPTAYVDITATRERKKAALFAHRSQEGEERIYRVQTEPTERLRGAELGVAAAEGFIRFGGSADDRQFLP